MIRPLLLLVLILVLYHAVKTVFRSAFRVFEEGDGSGQTSGRLAGEEMVQDPQCRTYVVKNRAVSRRIDGTTVHFCSEECADAYLRGRSG